MNNLRSQPSIHICVYKRTLQATTHQPEHQHSIPPPNGWTVGTNKPMARTIPTHLLQLPSRRLGQLATTSTIHSQRLVKRNDPFKLIMGHIPRVHQPTQVSTSPTVTDRLQSIKEARQDTLEAIRRAQDLVTRTTMRFTVYCVRD